MSSQPRPLSRITNPPPRRLRSPRLSVVNGPPQRQPTKHFLLADLRLRHEKLVARYEAAVKNADVASGLRDRLAAQIRTVEKGIAALS